MKKTILVLAAVLFFVLFSATSHAQNRKHMLGVRISTQDPVINHSITYKYFFNPELAVEGLFTFSDPVALGFLLQKHQPIGPGALTWFWGLGAYTGFAEGRNFGAQGALGLDLTIPSVPINLSLDWKPELNFIREFSFEPAALGVSARFTFN